MEIFRRKKGTNCYCATCKNLIEASSNKSGTVKIHHETCKTTDNLNKMEVKK